MATTTADIKTTYPLPVYNYRVEIDGTAISFSEVSGLAVGLETTTYKESPTTSGKIGPYFRYMPSQRQAGNIALKKGLVPKNSSPVLYTWLASTQINQVQKKDITVHLMDETGTAIVSWKVLNAFPTKLDAPTFDA